MSFMKKILNVLNMSNWNESQRMIEEKEPKPKNVFWDEEPEENNYFENNDNSQETYEEESNPYEYLLFSKYGVDTSEIIGSRQDFMRMDYTIEPIYYKSCQFLHKIWKGSSDLQKITKAKKFFEKLEEFENLLYSKEKYIYGKFNIELERSYYSYQKDELLIKFLDRCFTNEYRSALELKTAKGRINRIDHWFMMMDYYKYYLTPNAISVLEALNKKWTGELMPNLLECKD